MSNRFVMVLIALTGLALLPDANAAPNFAVTTLPDDSVKLTAEDGAEGDWFGASVAMSGDMAVVGAWFDADAGRESGSAYVFVRGENGNWTQQAKLTADDAAVYDRFGWSVAMSGDTAVVGAYGDNGVGSAYVFTRGRNGAWTQQAKLTADDAARGDQFGLSVGVSGDTAVVGAYGDNGVGSAYVFTRGENGQWTQQAKLTADDAAGGDWFGFSVGVSGDTTAVGAPYDDDASDGSGSAYVFVRGENGAWTQQAKLTADDAAGDDNFGVSVVVSGSTAVVGAPYDDDASESSGSAYVFVREENGAWTQQAKLTADDAAGDDNFGYSVVVSGSTTVIGAYRDDDGAGSAYVFVRGENGAWTQQVKLTADDAAARDNFGLSVGVSGGMAVVGAYADDDAGFNSGSAYIYTRDGDGNWTRDVGLPNAVCQNITVKINLAGDDVTITAAQIDGGSTDNFEIASLAIAPETITAAQIGIVPVTLTVTDTSGNQATCTADVFVTSVLDVNGDGVISPADAIYVANRLGNDPVGDDLAADIDGDGDIDADDFNLVTAAIGQTVP